MKLHGLFAHPTSNKLIKLINSAGQEWRNNQNLKAEIFKVTNECNTCQIFKKPSPWPVVGLPVASWFLECVAIDLKFYRKHILLHMIDHATFSNLSASTIITSKKPNIIISKIFQVWISLYGLPEIFLVITVGNLPMTTSQMHEAMNINFKINKCWITLEQWSHLKTQLNLRRYAWYNFGRIKQQYWYCSCVGD